MTGGHTTPAIDDGRSIHVGVPLRQCAEREEEAVGIHVSGVRDVHCTRDVPGLLVDGLGGSCVSLGVAGVDERPAVGLDRRAVHHPCPLHHRGVGARSGSGFALGDGKVGGHPCGKASVQDGHFGVAYGTQHPPQPSGNCSSRIVVCHDVVRPVESEAPQRSTELLCPRKGVPSGAFAASEVRFEVAEDRTREMSGVVLDPSSARVGEVPAHVHDSQISKADSGSEV